MNDPVCKRVKTVMRGEGKTISRKDEETLETFVSALRGFFEEKIAQKSATDPKERHGHYCAADVLLKRLKGMVENTERKLALEAMDRAGKEIFLKNFCLI